jgi:outer membrane receptor for ferrienterochelin and colicins
MRQRKIYFLFTVLLTSLFCHGQIVGSITDGTLPLEGVSVFIPSKKQGTISDAKGRFILQINTGKDLEIVFSYTGFIPKNLVLKETSNSQYLGEIILESDTSLDEVIISGNLKPVNRLESTIPVEVYSPEFLQHNPSPNLFEGIQYINGIRPQINCSVCNTGDIHINGLEGPYTFVLIDGMPIVSSLASVYGLNGIPTGMIEKVEIIKGPAGTLYGSQAVGGLINIITKLPEYSPQFFSYIYGTSWQEFNTDIGFTGKMTEKIDFLTGINGYFYDNPIDNNNDNFTDVTQQKRFSLFQKFSWTSSPSKRGSFAIRYLYEDRWGGELDWTSEYRGGDQIYGESIYTKRFEIIGSQNLSDQWEIQYSYTDHDQDSFYGDMSFQAKERIGFVQGIWQKESGKHQWLGGLSTRYSWYDDNTPATEILTRNNPNRYWLPGVFLEDEIALKEHHKLLIGMRVDHHPEHGFIGTPRMGYKINFDEQTLLRLNAGTGFRVVNIFTEDHAALTGARDLIIEEDLSPEQSYNINLNFYKKSYTSRGWILGLEAALWHTYFSNQILPDFDSNPNEIRYNNLDGHAVSQGGSLNFEATYGRFRAQIGASILDVFTKENNLKIRPVFTEKWSMTWAITAPLWNEKFRLDYTGNLYGPMRLPLLGELDPRAEFSPVWSIQNLKFSYQKDNDWNLFVGVKNLLNWTPAKNNPFLIARSNDPFDRNVQFEPNGTIQATDDNPYALSFDPTYIYASNQGIRFFIGLNYSLSK